MKHEEKLYEEQKCFQNLKKDYNIIAESLKSERNSL